MQQQNLQLVDTAKSPMKQLPNQQQVAATCAINVSNVTVSYDGRPVLRSVSFSITPNQMVGVIGPNGAGKSTLMKAILGLVPLNTGQISFFGEPIQTCRDRIAYVPQTEAVDWDFPVTVLDVVMMGRARRMAFKLWPGKRDRQLALDALDLVDMTDFRDRHIRQLSGGQQQRVFLARALCQEADILLLDEPFAGVDAATEKAIFALIAQLTLQGKTLLVINHDLNVLDQFDQLLLLNQHIIAFGPTADVATDDNLKRTYGGRLSLLERADESLRRQRGPKL
jgi:manganese/zinc/iron transport system ATP- binding protein